MLDFSVIVVTHNRADSLRETIASIAAMQTACSWELIVVDNDSTDGTRAVVGDAASSADYPVRYVHEPRPGKYGALNTGIRAATGRFVATTDDDALPSPDWLDRAAEGFARFDCDFVGGPVFPLWRAAPPSWLDQRSSVVGKVLALQDYGGRPREYGRGIAWPLGVNVAYRRDVFASAGPFDASPGRTAGTLRSQAQREWHLRARAAGARGFYLPRMIVDHVIWPERLTKRYFRRWFFWHGVSRAILYRKTGWDLIEPGGGEGHRGERQVGGIPISVLRTAFQSSRSALYRHLRGEGTAAFEYELWLCICAGIARQRWRDRRKAPVRPARPKTKTCTPASGLRRVI